MKAALHAPAANAAPADRFLTRHVGPRSGDLAQMLGDLGYDSLDALAEAAIPASIRYLEPLDLPAAVSEAAILEEMRDLARGNEVRSSYIGMGYSDCITPPVILRNILENPGWYTQYTPYQAEIAQGRLEALFTYQSMVADLTGLPITNASLLDEATAAAEAMTMALAANRHAPPKFYVADGCHPQTPAVLRTRARAVGIELVEGPLTDWRAAGPLCGLIVQSPTTHGEVLDLRALAQDLHQSGALLLVATDLLANVLFVPPGEMGADLVVGSAQRLGVPMGYGGPHAAFLAAREEFKRQMPGRIVGLTRTVDGQAAYRLALQTREQHIRREKATSNICTAQVLLAIMAGAYAVYHGPEGLRAIATRIRDLTERLRSGLGRLGLPCTTGPIFDTVRVLVGGEQRARILAEARTRRLNLRIDDPLALGASLDETTTAEAVTELLEVFAAGARPAKVPSGILAHESPPLPAHLERHSAYLQHPVFQRYRSETEFQRYLARLQSRDLSLTTSMIPLGSCTMKLNAAVEMLPITWPEFGRLHPFAPAEQARGYALLFERLERMLAEITGFSAVSLQPNAGSQGEYAGLLVIRAWHASRNESHRNVCLIPESAHGTNPASAVMAGLAVVAVRTDDEGRIDLSDLAQKAKASEERLAAIMVTYPSTFGVFEDTIGEVARIVHAHGGQVYLDGANLNAQMGLCRPGDYGADVCHINLHKTFCIPHGGGGPGMGPIAVAEHLAPFLPGHPLLANGRPEAIGPVAAAPWGSAGILPIPYAFIRLLGAEGLRRASQVAILNANYMARRLASHFPILYTGASGLVAHEFILDLRSFKKRAGIDVEDVAKRLMDYGFHAPTVSWPVAGTLMIEPTESESKEECDRFCDALIAIAGEVGKVEAGLWPREDNPLVNAPHTAQEAIGSWAHPYSREEAVFPAPWTREHKFWPPVKRADNVHGDRNLICTCPAVSAYEPA